MTDEYDIDVDPEVKDFYDDLRELDGVTERKAAGLANEYRNRTTLSWATSRDQDYLQDTYQINPDFLKDQMRDADQYRWWRRRKAKLIEGMPERREDWLDRTVYPLQSELDQYDPEQGWLPDERQD